MAEDKEDESTNDTMLQIYVDGSQYKLYYKRIMQFLKTKNGEKNIGKRNKKI